MIGYVFRSIGVYFLGKDRLSFFELNSRGLSINLRREIKSHERPKVMQGQELLTNFQLDCRNRQISFHAHFR